MKLFCPSQNILEKICKDSRIPLIQYEIYPRINNILDMENLAIVLSGLKNKLCEFYKIGYDKTERKRIFLSKVFNVVGESLKNCYDHGKDKEITFGLFLGDKGVCYGFNNGSNYFKDEKIKHQYENKIKITEFDRKTLKTNCQVGVNYFIYPNSDFIEVDAETGTLFCAQFKKNIIAPKGEDGEKYFCK